MSFLSEKLADFSGAISSGATFAPDEYPEWGYVSYESNMSDIKEIWSEIRMKLKLDTEKIAFIERKLQDAFAAFDAGEKEKGRAALWAIYNLDVEDLQ